MQDLTGKFPALLTPTSQEGGNMIQPDLGKAAMSAPGSPPVSPLPGPTQGSDPKIDYSGPEIPVSNVPHSPKPASTPTGSGHWGNAKFPGSPWKETS